MHEVPAHLIEPLKQLLLSIADDKLMLGHRNSDWTGLAPILEEDIAFSAIAQDEIAHAQALYELIGSLTGERADDIAFGREIGAYRCAQIVEPGDGFDWGVALVRQLFCDHFDAMRLARAAQSAYKPLADLAARLVAEERVHVEHADTWLVRLGRGTGESHDRLQRAVYQLLPLAPSLFEPVEGQDDLEQASLYPPSADLYSAWRVEVGTTLERANLRVEFPAQLPTERGGRRGIHTPALAELLDEMCEVYRTEPGAAW
ncbi:MAG TPA: phenylacetate-CoA oxygenase subunit PaaC [Phycisphaerales bacterium]|nr:phenylacetate-CoA oxygenase subunit PaaC [Phycisphaerales bacterium]HRQ75143.1 phenylacetate-CoA oxygenase subunit PaaC [Phycisphaerales bacterium]